jgi:hypothetical protein
MNPINLLNEDQDYEAFILRRRLEDDAIAGLWGIVGFFTREGWGHCAAAMLRRDQVLLTAGVWPLD